MLKTYTYSDSFLNSRKKWVKHKLWTKVVLRDVVVRGRLQCNVMSDVEYGVK